MLCFHSGRRRSDNAPLSPCSRDDDDLILRLLLPTAVTDVCSVFTAVDGVAMALRSLHVPATTNFPDCCYRRILCFHSYRRILCFHSGRRRSDGAPLSPCSSDGTWIHGILLLNRHCVPPPSYSLFPSVQCTTSLHTFTLSLLRPTHFLWSWRRWAVHDQL
jgi:hypothetical protein